MADPTREAAFAERGAKHNPMCNAVYEAGYPCDCELDALRRLARASGEIVRLRLLPAGNCMGDPEQELVAAHGAWVEVIS